MKSAIAATLAIMSFASSSVYAASVTNVQCDQETGTGVTKFRSSQAVMPPWLGGTIVNPTASSVEATVMRAIPAQLTYDSSGRVATLTSPSERLKVVLTYPDSKLESVPIGASIYNTETGELLKHLTLGKPRGNAPPTKSSSRSARSANIVVYDDWEWVEETLDIETEITSDPFDLGYWDLPYDDYWAEPAVPWTCVKSNCELVCEVGIVSGGVLCSAFGMIPRIGAQAAFLCSAVTAAAWTTCKNVCYTYCQP